MPCLWLLALQIFKNTNSIDPDLVSPDGVIAVETKSSLIKIVQYHLNKKENSKTVPKVKRIDGIEFKKLGLNTAFFATVFYTTDDGMKNSIIVVRGGRLEKESTAAQSLTSRPFGCIWMSCSVGCSLSVTSYPGGYWTVGCSGSSCTLSLGYNVLNPGNNLMYCSPALE